MLFLITYQFLAIIFSFYVFVHCQHQMYTQPQDCRQRHPNVANETSSGQTLLTTNKNDNYSLFKNVKRFYKYFSYWTKRHLGW